MDELPDLRRKIDEIDARIIRLLKERMDLSREIGKIKLRNSLPIRDPSREREVYNKIEQVSRELGLAPSYVRSVFKDIIAYSAEAQGPEIGVAFLGPAGSFSEQAARRYFATGKPQFMEKSTISNVVRSVAAGETEYGVVPVENSTEGPVNLTLDLLIETDLQVCGEIEEKISLNLIAPKNTRLERIKHVISHPQALAQCRQFLEENLLGAKMKESSSTSTAVRLMRRVRESAAIGTALAAKTYGMSILAANIEDNPNNYTRFFVLGRSMGQPTGNDKTSIVFSVKHVPGALHSALECFARRSINLTKVESRPTRKKPWDYVFLIDFEGHVSDKSVQEAIRELREKCTFLKILGSYPKAVAFEGVS